MILKEVHIKNKKVNLITLKNQNVELALLDIFLQYRHIEEYIENKSFFESTVGRVASRIEDGLISIDGKKYTLNKNCLDKDTLHGDSSNIAI
jgi:galactose mutarotase-like enzyme